MWCSWMVQSVWGRPCAGVGGMWGLIWSTLRLKRGIDLGGGEGEHCPIKQDAHGRRRMVRERQEMEGEGKEEGIWERR